MKLSVWIPLLALIWVIKPCFTLEEVETFLNELPLERALEAKIVVINSQRSFLSSMSNPYYVFYRQEK